ncbi:hypothetical protein ABG915_06410 [Bifidobacterium longum]|uniref:DUF7698 family protein n=1 Tax=Bifidobacterium longum TaxID=216816 RepID=UPI002065585D|nr:hypothetical protein [Bifidobacterium longum]DAG39972.1 MAG TPA: hypothetical protein [Caudoviricetes sp.]
MMEKNSRLEEMRETAIAYNTARAVREKDREAMIEAGDWDGVKAFDEREKAEFPYPFTQGAVKALTAYDRSLERGADAFEVEDLPWENELADFTATLRDAGITTIVVTDRSTALMDGIYGLTALGCRMAGLRTVTRADDHRFGSKEPERKNGIEFRL